MESKRALITSVCILLGLAHLVAGGHGTCRAGTAARDVAIAEQPCSPGRVGRHSCEVSPTASTLIANGSVSTVLGVWITNTGDYVYEGVIEKVSPCPYFQISDDGPYSINPGEFHILNVSFETTECDTFHCHIKTGAQDVHLTGIGQGLGCSRSGPDTEFGTVGVGSYADKEYWFTNNNCVEITLDVDDHSSNPPIRVASGEGEFTVQPGDSHHVVIRFEPPMAGHYQANIAIGYGGGECNWMTFYGTGWEPGGMLRLVSSRTGEGVRATYWLDADGPATLKVYDPTGRLVKTLLNDHKSAGRHEHLWDLNNESGLPVTSGVYFVALEHAGRTRVEKTMVLR